MEPRIVNPDPKYAPPPFRDPPPTGYLLLAASVAPPAGPPLVRPDPRRAALLTRLKQLAGQLAATDEVDRVTVYRAILIAPAGIGSEQAAHSARYDVAVLAETRSRDELDEVRAAPEFEAMLAETKSVAAGVHVMPAHCLRNLGDVDKSRPGLFLFNYFAAADREAATTLWEHLAGWYVAETGLDNSTLLAPVEPGAADAPYVFVNHARWDKSLPRLALEQFLKPSFHRYVRANLRANGVVAMPALYRLA